MTQALPFAKTETVPPASDRPSRLHAARRLGSVLAGKPLRVPPRFVSQKGRALAGPSWGHRNLQVAGRSRTNQAVERISRNEQARRFRHCTRRGMRPRRPGRRSPAVLAVHRFPQCSPCEQTGRVQWWKRRRLRVHDQWNFGAA